MKLFDAHSHLQMPQFDADRGNVIRQMIEGEVGSVVIGVDLSTSKAGLELVKQYDFLWAAVGLHPNDNPTEHFDMEAFEELARDSKVIAIGECGLDYFRSGSTPEEKSAQKKRFDMHVDLALKVDKPLIIHCRNAHEDMIAILSELKKGKGEKLQIVIHFFTGSGDLAQKYLDLGCYLSFPGPITYTDMYDESIRIAPLDRILSETDSPFAAPVPFRGKRNEPTYVEHVVAKIAAVKNFSVEEVAAQIVKNAQQIFKI
jgi:TatD DNase family protein